ncbi:MAG: PqiC family protein [Vicinamibacteria bacterium]|nr:PqiC family protein [Vicinamibacteria bacterium]
MRARTLAVLAVSLPGLAAGGCLLGRTKAARTYVLDPLAVQRAAEPAPAPLSAISVDKVIVPDWLDRPQVTGRGAAGEIVTDEYSLWGEPFAKGVQRVVAENLAALCPDRRILAAPVAPREAVDQRLALTVVDASRQPDGAILVEARWDVVGKGGAVLARRRTSHRAAAPAGPKGAVAGVSEALAALSQEIADALKALPAPEPSR